MNRWLAKIRDTRVILFLIFTITCTRPTGAQPAATNLPRSSDRLPALFSGGIGFQHGFIFPHSQAVQNTQGARPTGAEAIMSWQRNDAPTWERCNCYPRQGVLLAYYTFDNVILGRGGLAAYFLEPTYHLQKNLFLGFKGAAGLTYLSNPFDSSRNPANQSYSTALSAYLLLGGGAWVRVGKQWWLNPTANYQHISNGGTKQPNKGINWPTAGLAISYQPQFRDLTKVSRPPVKPGQNYLPRYEVLLLGTPRRGYNRSRARIHSPLLGVAVQGARQVGRLSALTLGAEIYHDGELQNKLANDAIAASPVKAGLLAGHEFILGKFLFSQRLGYYLFDQTPYYDQIFHRWGLQYYLNARVGLGFNLLAHRQTAELVDVRISYAWQKKPD